MGEQVAFPVYSGPINDEKATFHTDPLPTNGKTGNIPHLYIQDQPMGEQVKNIQVYSESTNGGTGNIPVNSGQTNGEIGNIPRFSEPTNGEPGNIPRLFRTNQWGNR
jgi:hypothetical protein